MWLRMMFIMHTSERYGYLVQNGTAINRESIARRCGCTPEQYDPLFDELSRAGVPGVTPDGTIFSRRMVKDQSRRDRTRERVTKHRNADVTGKKSEIRDQRSEVREKQKKAAAPPDLIFSAFEALGFQPFGSPEFQGIWVEEWQRETSATFVDRMERTAVRCQESGVKVPGMFFEIKRKAEEGEVHAMFKRTPL